MLLGPEPGNGHNTSHLAVSSICLFLFFVFCIFLYFFVFCFLFFLFLFPRSNHNFSFVVADCRSALSGCATLGSSGGERERGESEKGEGRSEDLSATTFNS